MWKKCGDDLLYSMIPRSVAEQLRAGESTLSTCKVRILGIKNVILFGPYLYKGLSTASFLSHCLGFKPQLAVLSSSKALALSRELFVFRTNQYYGNIHTLFCQGKIFLVSICQLWQIRDPPWHFTILFCVTY
jgi:hypothetical protein